MAYCTLAQVEAQFPILTDKIDSTATDYIARADAMIDAALAKGRYVTPVVSPTADITMWSIYGVALMAGIQLENTAQTNAPFSWTSVQTWYVWMVEEAKKGILQIPRYTSAPTVTSDSMTDPDYSQFELPAEFTLNND
jgi:hypothetical protein